VGGVTQVFKNVVMDEHVVMPNHIHGIVSVIDEIPVGNASEHSSGNNKLIENRKKNIETELNAEMRSLQYDRSKMLISKIIQIYKSEVTRRIKRISNGKIKSSILQKSFYDRIIRNEKEFQNIQAYIHYYPLKWEWDIENKTNSGDSKKYYVNMMNGK
jgi:putative transposase